LTNRSETERLRLAMASQTYDRHQSGQGVFAVHLAEELARAGHEVLMIAPSEHLRSYRTVQNGVQVQAVSAVPMVPFSATVHVTPLPSPTVRRTLEEFQPQIVHIQDHYPLCRSVAKVAIEWELPLVATNHFLPENIIDEVRLFQLAPGALTSVLWKMMLDLFNQADVVTTPTETGAEILRCEELKVPVHPISCGVEVERFRPDPEQDRAEMRRRYGLDPECTLFLYVGRIEAEKRLDVLLRALQQLDREDIQVAIAGRGAQRKELEGLAGELLVEQRVVFTGFVPDADLPGLLSSADVFAMPSDAELQSIATLEAMAAGRPILAANARALPELVKNGVNGYLFKHGDPEDAARAMALLADRPEDWAAMGATSRQMALPHDLANTIRQYEELYRSVMRGSEL
jgi:1,2-diacylglycerol 3-alpha-glucosyltransferase